MIMKERVIMRKVLSLVLAAATVVSCVAFSAVNADAYAIKGDLNGDNKISLRDASIAQKIDVGLITASSDQMKAGDINGDGSVNSQDSLLLQKYVCLDKATIEMITPQKEERLAFVQLINNDRIDRGLAPFTVSDSHLEAGTIRAQEYVSTGKDNRPDGSEFYSVLEECNLSYNPNATPNQVFISALPDCDVVYRHLVKNYTGNEKMYTLLTSEQYTTLCVGCVPKTGNTDNYQWCIIVN